MIDYLKHTKIRDENGKMVRLYTCWCDMIARCYNENNKNYHQYAGKGITVCSEWKEDYQIFRIWSTQNGYKDNLTLDRINFKGNYEPNNCRWITIKEQQNNRCNNMYIEFNGETKTLSEWCEKLNLKYPTINSRINRSKCDPLVALGLAGKFKSKDETYFVWNGYEKSYSEWCKITGEKLYNVHNRINNCGWSIEKALGLFECCQKY